MDFEKSKIITIVSIKDFFDKIFYMYPKCISRKFF